MRPNDLDMRALLPPREERERMYAGWLAEDIGRGDITTDFLIPEDATARFVMNTRHDIVVCGVESHVCVMQTAADLDAQGYTVHIVADACGSRAPASKDAALARFGALGISRVTTEMALFEWLEAAGTAEFKAVSRFIK